MIRVFICFLLIVPGITNCSKEGENAGPRYGADSKEGKIPVYSFAVHPLHNPNKLMEAYRPLIDYLNSRVKGAMFRLEASRDYASYEEKYRARKPEFLLPNPWQTLQAMKTGYRVIAMAGEPFDFRGIFIVRKDSGIRTPQDLRGRAVSYPSPTALAACIMPQYYLYRQGINVNRDIENRYVGSQESSIMNVYLKKTAAGATWPPPWRAFQKDYSIEASELKVAWETGPLINNSVMIRGDIPAEVREQVKKHLTDLHKTGPGKAILAGMETARFIPAEDNDYDIVRVYVERFEREVRKVEVK